VLFTVNLMLRNSYMEWTGKRNFAADLCGRRRSPFCPSVAAVELPRAVVIFKEQDGIYRRNVPEGGYYSWHICLTHWRKLHQHNLQRLLSVSHCFETSSRGSQTGPEYDPFNVVELVPLLNRRHAMKTYEEV